MHFSIKENFVELNYEWLSKGHILEGSSEYFAYLGLKNGYLENWNLHLNALSEFRLNSQNRLIMEMAFDLGELLKYDDITGGF